VRWLTRLFECVGKCGYSPCARTLTAYNHSSESPGFFRQIAESATTPDKASLVVEPGPEWAPCLPA
jgi:hypothetical protein